MSRIFGGPRDVMVNDPILPADHEPDDLPDEPRRPRRHRLAVIALVVAVALALAATSLFWLIVSPGGRAASFANARVGDCLVADGGGTAYTQVECGDPTAQFQVMAVAQDRSGCVDVPGVTRAHHDRSGYLCIGARGVDPASSLNGIAPGDCVSVGTDGIPTRAACEGDTSPVLAVLTDVPKSVGEATDGLVTTCRDAGATDVRQTYAWGLDATDGTTVASWDRVLCLGQPDS